MKYLRSHASLFELFDEVMSERIRTKSVTMDQFAMLMEEIATYNQQCQSGEEVTLQLVCLEGEEFVSDNLEFMEKSQLIGTIGGYATSGVMQ